MKTSKTYVLMIAAMVIVAVASFTTAQEKPKSAKDKLLEMMQEPNPAPAAKAEPQNVTKKEKAAPVRSAVSAQPKKIKKTEQVAQAISYVSTSPMTKEETNNTIQQTNTVSEDKKSSVSPAAADEPPGDSSFGILFYALLLATFITITIIRRNIMKWFLDLQIGTKLISSFLLVAGIAAFVGYFGITKLQQADNSDTMLFENFTVPMGQMSDIAVNFQRIRVNTRDVILAKNIDEMNEFITKIETYRESINKIAGEYEKTIVSKEMQDMFAEFKESRVEYAKHLDALNSLAKANKDQEAMALLQGDMKKSANREMAIIEKMVDAKVTAAKAKSDSNTVEATAAQTIMLTVVVIGVLIAIALGFFISRMISNPVKELITNIDNADLNNQFNSVRKDEIGGLQRSFDKFVLSIKDTLVQVSEASSAVASASTEISSSTEQMAAGAQEQSSQAAEVATAVEEMTKTLGETNGNIRKVADGAKSAKDSANEGGTVVEDTIKGMKRISDVVNQSAEQVKVLGASSDKIGEIIGVIDDIADQTNLLALNAAIEAARAGEQGRGFAVVADEVRKLAERTSKATKEIASMIKQIQADTNQAVTSMDKGTEEVSKGITLAEQAGQMLLGIVGNAESVADMVSQIAAASEQQASASEQISKNVEAISTVTQESASGVQQIAKTAEDLNRLTENLQQLLEKFNLGGTEQVSRHPQQKRETAARKTTSAQKSKKAVSENGHLVEHY